MSDMRVTLDEATSRYIIVVDGVQAGFIEIDESDAQVVFTHTEVSRDFEGKGVAGRLAHDALADVVERGKTIVPKCAYIARYLSRHNIPGAQVEPVE